MRRLMIAGVIAAFALVLPTTARAFTYDVSITRAGVTFVPSTFYLGDRVRIYAQIENLGDRDVEGSIFFSENGTAVGTPQPFSAKARGVPEDVWAEWQPATAGERQIFVRVVTSPETRDENLANNEMIVPVTIRPPAPPPAASPTGNSSPPSAVASTALPAGEGNAAVVAPRVSSPTVHPVASAKKTVISRPPPASPPVVKASVTPPSVLGEEIARRPPEQPTSVRFNQQLRQLLGDSIPWRPSVLSWIAGIVAAVCLIIVLILVVRRGRRMEDGED